MEDYQTLKAIAIACMIVLLAFTCWVVINHAHGQNATPPKPVTSPPNPTPTTPNPNFQYLPQKAYVLPFAPENGVPVSPPLATPLAPTVPQVQTVQPVPVQQQSVIGQAGELWAIVNTLIAGGSGILAKMGFDKAKKAQNTSQENAQTVVKVVEVQEEGLNLQYDNMTNKGNEITNRPVIKQDNIKKIKDQALDTAAKA